MKNTGPVKHAIHYQLYAQNRNGSLIIKNIRENNYFIRDPNEVIHDPDIFSFLSREDAEFVKILSEL